jgi:hypothetical protein
MKDPSSSSSRHGGGTAAAGIAAGLLIASSAPALRAQDLAPRAYVITLVRSNPVTVT